ncbi:MAG: hypothetical protein R6W66_10365 [Pelovirga sp.]
MSRTSLFITVLLLSGLSGGVVAAQDPAAAQRGANLYLGVTAFSNGGAPCLACHAHSGSGLEQSSGYGPDLSGLYEQYGGAGVQGVLEFLQFPSMEALYRDRPLTEQEIADLTAFFGRTGAAEAGGSDRLFSRVAGSLVIVAGLTLVAARRRRQPGARQALIDRQRQTLNKGGQS